MSDFESVFPPDKFIRVERVPLLDEHTAKTVKGNKKVDEDELKKIAVNNNRRWTATRDATPICIGHTSDDAKREEDQPRVVGWAVNFTTGPFFETGRSALFSDFFIRREDADVLTKFPRRSVEYWIKRSEIDPISLLGSTTPERDLSVLKFSRDPDEQPYRYSLASPQPTSTPDESVMADSKKDDMTMPNPTDANPDALADAKAGEGKSAKETSGKLDELMAAVKSLQESLPEMILDTLEQLLGGQGGEQGQGGGDLLGPDEDDAVPADKGKDAKKDAAKKDDAAGRSGTPMKLDANSTNCYVPGTDSEKTKMSRDATESDEVLKLRRQFEAEQQKSAREQKELRTKLQRMKAEKTVAELETNDAIDFVDAASRTAQIDLMAQLSDGAFDAHVGLVKTHYKRKAAPGGGSLDEVLKHSRNPNEDATTPAGPESAWEIADRASREGLSYEDAVAKYGKKK